MKTSKTVISLIPVLACIFLSNTTFAQFSLSGEFRPRTEYLHGYRSLAETNQDGAFWTEQRSRLKFNYASDKYNVGLVLQDVRIWGSVSQLGKTDGLSSIHEAWGEILFNDNLSVKLGRQEVIYDDHRIFGNVGWTQQARSHDMVKFQFMDSTTMIHLGLAYNQDRPQLNTNVYTVPNSYKAFQYLWIHKNFESNLGASILLLNNGLQYSETDSGGVAQYSDKYSQTIGTHLSYKKDKLKLIGAFYYQTGKDRADRDIGAYDLRGEAFYGISDNVTIGAGYELLSGTSQVDVTNKKNNSFTPLYGTNHKFNGFMDYFYVGNHINNVGLQDIYLKLLYKKNKVIAGIDVHFFSAEADVLDVELFNMNGTYTAMDASLGTEIDATIKYNYSKDVAFQLGYANLFGKDSMVALKGGDTDEVSNWAYLMVTFKPTFFSSAKK